jgi:FkbM family methyltransferase
MGYLVERITSLAGLISYNKDWVKYLSYRFTGENDRPVTFRLRGGNHAITMPPQARFTLNELFRDHVYDVQGFDWSRCRYALDLGANVGAFALYVARRAPTAKIYCFEPEPDNFELLRRNVKLNALNAEIFPFAVADRCGDAALEMRESTSHRLGSSGVSVQCVDLAGVFRLTGVDHFDYSKIDIEGAEVGLLATATKDDLHKLGAVTIEWHDSEALSAGAARLRAAGLSPLTEICGPDTYLKWGN